MGRGSLSRRKPLGKTMLLPHTATFVREQSLHWHLALAAFRIGNDGDLLAELVKALYLPLVSSGSWVRCSGAWTLS